MQFWRGFATTVRMPAIYDLVASSAWQLGALFGLTAMALGVGRGLADRKASLVGLVVVALGGLALVGLTVWGLYAPTFALETDPLTASAFGPGERPRSPIRNGDTAMGS